MKINSRHNRLMILSDVRHFGGKTLEEDYLKDQNGKRGPPTIQL